MFRTEENLNPHDTYIFNMVPCLHPNEHVSAYCEYQTHCLGAVILNSAIHDGDYTYFEDIEMFDVLDKFRKQTLETLSDLHNLPDDDEHHPDVYMALDNNPDDLGETLYWQYLTYHTQVLSHIMEILNHSARNGVNYRDFTLSAGTDRIVLRLMKGLYP